MDIALLSALNAARAARQAAVLVTDLDGQMPGRVVTADRLADDPWPRPFVRRSAPGVQASCPTRAPS